MKATELRGDVGAGSSGCGWASSSPWTASPVTSSRTDRHLRPPPAVRLHRACRPPPPPRPQRAVSHFCMHPFVSLSPEGKARKCKAELRTKPAKRRFCSFVFPFSLQRARIAAASAPKLFWACVWHSFVGNSCRSGSRSCAKGTLSTGQAILISVQLFFGGVIAIYIDELLKKGYGLISSVPLFTTTNICTDVFWNAFSPCIIQLYGGGRGNQFGEGTVISSLIHRLISNGNDELSAMHKALNSRGLLDTASVIATCSFFLLILSLQGFYVVLPLRSIAEPRLQKNYTLRLSYLSIAPLLLQDLLVISLYFIPQLVYTNFGENKVVNLLGKWKESKYFGQAVPVSGFAYYVTTPPTLADVGRHPFQTLIYALWLLLGCGFASLTFFEVCACSERYVARLLGEPRSVTVAQPDFVPMRRWKRYVATAAFLVGLCVGALTLLAGLAGVVGSGTGIMLATTVLYKCFEEIRGRPAGALGL